ncbi:MAG TPA: TPM domain-containing protein [Thermoanaerobaculia bacterium]|nr:TPM domain-containing protein [Thermoanaerobaculia bacterium]
MLRIVLLLAAALPLLANIPLPPKPAQWVTDAANVIPDDREAALNARLEQYECETSNQILVYVGRRVPAGTTLEEMGPEAIRAWGVGDKDNDNGAILFLFVDDRKSRIEVGYGLEGTLTDARSKQILVTLRYSLQNGDFATAAELGAAEIIGTLTPSTVPVAAVDTAAAIAARNAEIAEREDKMLIPMIIASLVLIPLLFYSFYRIVFVGDWKLGGGSGSSSSRSSSSSSSSGFSGRGGSGGGGGASDSW